MMMRMNGDSPQTLDDYLPQLRGIMGCVSSGDIALTSEPCTLTIFPSILPLPDQSRRKKKAFTWRTTLSSNLFNTSPRLVLPSLHADLASSLLTYASALSNLARSNVASLGAYERERATTDADRRAKDDRLHFAVTLLCRASGVYSYIAETVLPEWNNNNNNNNESESSSSGGVVGTVTTGGSRPPDLSSEVNAGLSRHVVQA